MLKRNYHGNPPTLPSRLQRLLRFAMIDGSVFDTQKDEEEWKVALEVVSNEKVLSTLQEILAGIQEGYTTALQADRLALAAMAKRLENEEDTVVAVGLMKEYLALVYKEGQKTILASSCS